MSKLNDLNISKSDKEIHAALERFAMKWQGKAERLGDSERISRF